MIVFDIGAGSAASCPDVFVTLQNSILAAKIPDRFVSALTGIGRLKNEIAHPLEIGVIPPSLTWS